MHRRGRLQRLKLNTGVSEPFSGLPALTLIHRRCGFDTLCTGAVFLQIVHIHCDGRRKRVVRKSTNTGWFSKLFLAKVGQFCAGSLKKPQPHFWSRMPFGRLSRLPDAFRTSPGRCPDFCRTPHGCLPDTSQTRRGISASRVLDSSGSCSRISSSHYAR